MIDQRSEFIFKSKCQTYSHSVVCREFGISRMTGYKWLQRFKKEGLPGLKDRSRRPKCLRQIPTEIVTEIVSYRVAHPSWGATTIRKILKRQFKKVPSRRTIHRLLQNCNFISTRRSHNRRKCTGRVVVQARYCNHIWTIDFKGWWRTKDGKKVFPLTVRDEFSKKILILDMLDRPSLELVKKSLILAFQRHGLPEYIRSDNGTPFAFSQGLCGLSRLSAWWIKLGIIPNFIPPASPQFNPAHERMHRDILFDLQRSPARHLASQQLVADQWRRDYNEVRPHTALDDKTPDEVYRRSKRKYKFSEPPLEYPRHMLQRYVNKQGVLKYEGRRLFVSKSIGAENVGLEVTSRCTINIWFGASLIAEWQTDTNTLAEYNLITNKLSVKKDAA